MSKEQDKTAIDGSPTKRQKVQQAVRHAKDKAKDLLNLDHHEVDDFKERTPVEQAKSELEDNPAFNPDKFLNDKKMSAVKAGGKFLGGLETAVETMIHPKQAIQSRATRTAAKKLAKGRPYISRRADLEFLDAYDEQKRAESSRSASDDEEEAERKAGDINNKTELVEQLQERRQAMRVAWVTDRHVHRVKVVDRNPGRFPKRDFFEEQDEDGVTKFRYDKWLAYVRVPI